MKNNIIIGKIKQQLCSRRQNLKTSKYKLRSEFSIHFHYQVTGENVFVKTQKPHTTILPYMHHIVVSKTSLCLYIAPECFILINCNKTCCILLYKCRPTATKLAIFFFLFRMQVYSLVKKEKKIQNIPVCDYSINKSS